MQKKFPTEIIKFNKAMNRTPNKALHYLALGDSYTIGESVAEDERFPIQLARQLATKNYDFDPPEIIAETGWTTDELEAAISKENLDASFDLVTLLIGVNNQYRGRSIKEFGIQFARLLKKAIAFAGNIHSNVIVISIPDYGVSPFADKMDTLKISLDIDAFNIIKKEISQKHQVKFVDITTISRQALNNEYLIAEDKLHFSAAMYDLWVKEIINTCFNSY